MNTFVWTLQLVLGVLFTLHGATLLIMPPQLEGQLARLPYPKGFLRFIGLCELPGGLGLILPWWLGSCACFNTSCSSRACGHHGWSSSNPHASE